VTHTRAFLHKAKSGVNNPKMSTGSICRKGNNSSPSVETGGENKGELRSDGILLPQFQEEELY